MFVRTSFTFARMTTGAFSRNIGKLFSELKLVTDNLSLYLYTTLFQYNSQSHPVDKSLHWEICMKKTILEGIYGKVRNDVEHAQAVHLQIVM